MNGNNAITEEAVLTNKELFDKLVPIFREILVLEEDTKALKEDAKEAELDFAAIASLAKAQARRKLDRVIDKAEYTIKLAEELQ